MTGFVGGLVFGLGGALVAAVAALYGGLWGERKMAGRIQLRYGPHELGPAGLLQPIADTLKFMTKEDITPSTADGRLFRIAPLLVFLPIPMVFVVIPFAAGWAPIDMNVGMLFFLAVPSLSLRALTMRSPRTPR